MPGGGLVSTQVLTMQTAVGCVISRLSKREFEKRCRQVRWLRVHRLLFRQSSLHRAKRFAGEIESDNP
jgi:hypothetical protein